jgi:hypothetical protein
MENKDKKINIRFSWIPFWFAGFLFTFGLTHGFVIWNNLEYDFWTKLLTTIVCYFLWPLLLGMHLAG